MYCGSAGQQVGDSKLIRQKEGGRATSPVDLLDFHTSESINSLSAYPVLPFSKTTSTKHKLLLVKKRTPVELGVVDGTPLSSGPITYETTLLPLNLKSHQSLAFNVASICSYPVILGKPW